MSHVFCGEKSDNACQICSRDTIALYCVWCDINLQDCTNDGILFIWTEEIK
jgi:hypothetical protein